MESVGNSGERSKNENGQLSVNIQVSRERSDYKSRKFHRKNDVFEIKDKHQRFWGNEVFKYTINLRYTDVAI